MSVSFDIPTIQMGQGILHLEHPNNNLPNGEIVELIYGDEQDLKKVTVMMLDGNRITIDVNELYAYVYKNGGYWLCGL